jgi:hypothetical protein
MIAASRANAGILLLAHVPKYASSATVAHP